MGRSRKQRRKKPRYSLSKPAKTTLKPRPQRKQLMAAFLAEENFWAAWEKVARNRGCAGVDDETIAAFGARAATKLAGLRKAIRKGEYHPLPVKQFWIPKKRGGWRELGVPAVRDRVVQQAMLNVLHPLMEPQFEQCSFAYRPGRSHKLAAEAVRHWHREGYGWVLDADVVKYFRNVEHQRLLAEFKERLGQADFLNLIEQWIGVGTLTKSGLILPSKGLPQGSVVSPILANIYLDDFDEFWLGTQLKLVRYADDFVILGRSEEAVQEAKGQVAQQLGSMGLRLHLEKTTVTNFDRGFRFLGHAFAKDVMVPLTKRQKAKQRARSESSPYVLTYSDPPAGGPTLMQQAMLASLKAEHKPIPPPLYVVLGYRVREVKPVKIVSKEKVWRTSMATAYLVDQGSVVYKKDDCFRIKRPQKDTIEVPMREVERVLVFGTAHLTTPAMAACLQQNIPVVFLSQVGSYKGHLWSAQSEDLKYESAQFERWGDAAFQLEAARAIVWGKLMNSKQLLLRLNRRRKSEEVSKAIASIERSLESVQTVQELEKLRGYEGNAARNYFPAFGQLITNDAFSFTTRNRRPPRDPVNSLLSFGYTLLYNNVLSMILVEGLNPHVGNLHRSERKETHLAFDLVEEFRSPIVDSLILTKLNRKAIRPTDFKWPREDGGLYLGEQGRRLFIQAFEERLGSSTSYPDVSGKVSYRRAIQLQVQRYKRCLVEDVPYEAFLRAV